MNSFTTEENLHFAEEASRRADTKLDFWQSAVDASRIKLHNTEKYKNIRKQYQSTAEAMTKASLRSSERYWKNKNESSVQFFIMAAAAEQITETLKNK